jgi:acetyltransferase-like isoleucine patch superfamily enzyme
MGFGVRMLKERLRQGNSWPVRALRAVVRGVYGFSVPVVGPLRWFYSGLYWTGHAVAEVLRRVVSGLLWKPMFIARCDRVGRGLQLEQLPYITGAGGIELGEGVDISGKISFAFNDRFCRPRIVLGDRVFVGHRCGFSAAAGVTVGADTLIATGTAIRDNDGHPLDPEARRNRRPIDPADAAPVTIGRNVWIGSGCLILKGVTIGDNAVIGACSVVTSDIPPYAVAVGAPARVVRRLDATGPGDGPVSR